MFALLELVQNTYFVVIPLRTACETNLSRGDEEEELAAAAGALLGGSANAAGPEGAVEVGVEDAVALKNQVYVNLVGKTIQGK